MVCGENLTNPSWHGNADAERVFRSEDGGQTWAVVVDRNFTNPKVYYTVLFDGNWVYLGFDMADTSNFIDHFYDDGLIGVYSNGAGSSITPQRVYTSPVSNGNAPLISAWLNSTMLFSSTSEFSNATTRIIASTDGLTWTTIKTANYTVTQNHANILTSNPKGVTFGSDGQNANFAIKPVAEPNPTPTPTPSLTPTSSPDSSPTTTPSGPLRPTPAPYLKPNPIPTATPQSTPAPEASPLPSSKPMQSASFSFNVFSVGVIAAVVIGSVLLTVAHVKRRNKQ
jgi:hypothetical protein